MWYVVALLGGGALYALAFPPYDWSALGWIALVPMLLAVRGRKLRWAFQFGAAYGVISAWMVGWWIAQAGARYFGLPFPLAVVGASLYAVIVWGTAFGIAAAGAATLLRPGARWGHRCAVPALWVAAELFRGRAIGQPWALLGYSQHNHVALIQISSFTGVYGVSFLVALVNIAVAEAFTDIQSGRGLRKAGSSLVLPAAIIAELWAIGAFIVQRGPDGGYAARSVAIVQTNVAPAYQWTQGYAERELAAHVNATERLLGPAAPALIVWPENAITQYVETDVTLAARLGELATRHRADLLFGAPRYEDGHVYNSVRLFTARGRNGGYYDKLRLVPFAEAGLLQHSASPATESPRVFTPGTEVGVLKSFAMLGVSICHEVLFPELVSRSVRAGAEILVNVSNDGWLDGGYGTASRQHFAMAVFRAVEARRYMVRAATTGVSGVIDAYGRVVQSLAPGTAGVLTVSVAARDTLTPYVRFGDVFGLICLGYAVAALRSRAHSPRAWRTRRLAPSPARVPAAS